jgi:hypothetical protein
MSGQRRVGTRAIQAAVKGCETNVLEALGIAWNEGAGHITCPYPNHADHSPSWRWDAKRQRAHCTCTERSHTILDVVMHREGLDFEAAKVRIAEILKRQDLIITADDPLHQAMDARSLLRPPPDQIDEQLPRAYLAYRLAVPADEVLLPSTPVAGWRGLPYYDPPAKKGAKPKLVGRHPCLVFGTISPQDLRHAHRIYTAPEGQGKADLGTDSRGRSRDPKKSARLREGQSASGCAVLWGDPAKAPGLVLAEGIETGAAVALAHRDEIEAGDLAVAAALSSVGLRTFQPWPANRRIVVAADRDEDRPPDDRSHAVGEKAARHFAFRHHDRLEVAIAVPGGPGDDMDWLDVLRRDGIEAVRAGIEGAAAYTPTRGEIEAAKRRADSAAELAAIETTYPLPRMESLRLAYRRTRSGRIMVHKYAGQDKEGEEIWLPVTTPFGVPARLRHVDAADAYGLRVVIQDMNGRPREIEFDRAALPRMGAADIRAELFRVGLRTEADGEAIAVQTLKAANPASEILLASRAGWHTIAVLDGPVFVTPAGDVLGTPPRFRLELAAAARLPGAVERGTLEGWKAAVAAAVQVPGCPHWILSAAAAFAGPILSLVGLDSCGINQSGLSSCGKTLGQKVAASAWGSPRIGIGLLQSLRTTENAVESLAQASTGTILALDEMAHVDGQTLGRLVYLIASGQGKARLTSQAAARQRSSWATFGILSGECSLEEKVRGDGGQWLAGMAVRFPDIDVTDVNRSVPQDTLDAIAAIDEHCGHAGPAFVQGLLSHGYHRNPEPLRQIVLRAARGIAGETDDSASVRAATPFGLLLTAGELAKEFDLLPGETAVAEAVQWGWRRFRASSDALALDPPGQVVAHLRTWIAERWGVTVKPTEPTLDPYGHARVNNRESVAWYDDDAVYIPARRIREAAGSALKEQEIARILDERGLIASRERGRLTVRYVPKVGHLQCYALSRAAFGRSEREDEPELAVLHGGRR